MALVFSTIDYIPDKSRGDELRCIVPLYKMKLDRQIDTCKALFVHGMIVSN